MGVTLKDVAAYAGVSPSTVSRVCKNNTSISKETTQKVRQAMLELGYEVNVPEEENAPDTRTIGVILPPSPKESFENSFYLQILRGVSQFCNQHKYMNTIITGRDNDEILDALNYTLSQQKIDGFVVAYSKQEDPITDYLYNEGLLYVVIGKAYHFASHTIYVDNDNVAAAQQATQYLIDLGHKNIAYIGNESNLMFSADRKSGYQLALIDNNMPVLPENVLELPYISEEDDSEIHNLLLREERPTAIVVSDDIFAVGLECICAEMNLSVPQDISIVSFNNSLFARLASPPITSIDVGGVQLGIEAASQVINHIENPNLFATKTIVPHRLIIRKSCQKL